MVVLTKPGTTEADLLTERREAVARLRKLEGEYQRQRQTLLAREATARAAAEKARVAFEKAVAVHRAAWAARTNASDAFDRTRGDIENFLADTASPAIAAALDQVRQHLDRLRSTAPELHQTEHYDARRGHRVITRSPSEHQVRVNEWLARRPVVFEELRALQLEALDGPQLAERLRSILDSVGIRAAAESS